MARLKGARTAVRKFAPLMLAPLVTGCSALGLQNLPYTECSDDTQCEPLNAIAGIGPDECIGWECRGGYCRLRPRDSDDDGAVRAICPMGTDCNDDSPLIGPEVLEECDGVDQDCDTRIDEAFVYDPLQPERVGPPEIVVADRLTGSVRILGDMRGGALATAVDDTEPRRPRFEAVDSLGEIVEHPLSALATASRIDAPPAEVRNTCALTTATPIPAEPSCTSALDCLAGQVCAARADGRRVCGSGGAVCATDEECGDGVFSNGLERCLVPGPTTDARGCSPGPRPCADAETVDEALEACISTGFQPVCSVRDIAAATAAVDPDLFLVAFVTDCSLRIAHLSLTDRLVSAFGNGGRSSSWAGIDPDPFGCTGASRPSGIVGARGPAIAALEADGSRTPQGLVAYLADPAVGGGTMVEIVGAWLETDSTGARWTHATGAGIPTALPEPAADRTTRPAVAALDLGPDSAYVVAYGAQGAGVAVALVDAFGEPAAACSGGSTEDTCVTALMDGPGTRLGSGALLTERDSAALPTPSSLARPGPAISSDVSIAVWPRRSADPEVAIAYVEADEIVFTVGTFDRTARMLTFAPGAAQRVDAHGASAVTVTHVISGVSSTGGTDDDGGFVLSWAGPDGTFVARSPDTSRELLPTVLLGRTTEAPRATLTADGLVVVAYRASDLLVFPFACGPVAE